VRWLAFPLHPETPADGLSLEQLFAGMPVDLAKIKARLAKTAADMGLPFTERTHTYNSRLAQELGLWAESKGRGHAFHLAVFHAYFADGKNIAQEDVLTDLAARVGLDPDQARSVLVGRTFAGQVDAHWQMARDRAITAVPTFLMGMQRLVGAQPHQRLVKLVETNGAARITSEKP